jgi:hypothetical protein
MPVTNATGDGVNANDDCLTVHGTVATTVAPADGVTSGNNDLGPQWRCDVQ